MADCKNSPPHQRISRIRGITVVEAIITITLTVTAIALTRVGVVFYNNVLRQQSLMKTQTDAEIVISTIQRQIRNATKIVTQPLTFDVAYNKLQLEMLDTRSFGFDAHSLAPTSPKVDPVTHKAKLFEGVFIGTVTYEYKGVGKDSYLERTEDFPARGIRTKKLLTGLLQTPTNIASPTAGAPGQYRLFFGDSDTVLVEFRMDPAMWPKGSASHQYKVRGSRRRVEQ